MPCVCIDTIFDQLDDISVSVDAGISSGSDFQQHVVDLCSTFRRLQIDGLGP